MPGLARKLIICAAIDGLIIQPLSSKGQRPAQPVRLRYDDNSISAVSRDQLPDTTTPGTSFEAFGVLGLITVSRLSYLITITRRQQVAQILGHPVYVVTEVAVTPCSSKADADESIKSTCAHLEQRVPHSITDDEGASDDDSTEAHTGVQDEVEDTVDDTPRSSLERSSVADDVLRKRGSYGRFAQQWFSRSGWTQDQKRTMGMGSSPPPTSQGSTGPFQPPPAKVPIDEEKRDAAPVSTLLPKLLRTVQFLFGTSRSFYFSYDIDITRSLIKRSDFAENGTPLYAQVDTVFFWNRNLLQPFMSAGQDSLSLPVMQGFVGQRTFVADSSPPQVDESAGGVEMSSLSPSGSIPSSPNVEKSKESAELRPSERQYLITLISRRSTKRAGLRYLRRGIDENGFVANMVETEQLLSRADWAKEHPVHSFVQIRGSIPAFFTQSPYSLKPIPVLQHSEDANFAAAKKHFERLGKQYGSLQLVNLVEKSGVEAPIGTQYQNAVKRFSEQGNEDALSFEWFDFHKACKGMKFENVSQLLLKLKDRLEEFGSTTQQGSEIVKRQKGVLRTNCMDCLDRTNVCQSSFAKHMLEVQLKEEGIDVSAQADLETMWFNTLWADNGDAVSKQYASTAAMKGDYTRTKKRDYRGALNDLGLSLARFYSGMVNDYFSQAAMDFLLGNVSAKVFEEFEADMMTKDPAVSMAKMREQAIDLCQRRCIEDEGEEYHGGWVLLSPSSSDTVKTWGMEEIVLLLTDTAFYVCRFDWNSDKVSSFERVHLSNVTHIKFGTYITSTVSSSQMDEMRNVGFVVTFQPGKNDFKRTNTRTFSSRGNIPAESKAEDNKDASQPASLVSLLSGRSRAPVTHKIAFKAPHKDSAVAAGSSGPQQTEIQQVVSICADIERLAQETQLDKAGEDKQSLIEKGEIISLEEAKRNTGLFEQLGHSIKKFVWA